MAGEIYGKTASALVAFMQDRPITKIYQPTQEPFPLPSDIDGAVHVSAINRMALNHGRPGAGRSATDRVVEGAAASLLA